MKKAILFSLVVIVFLGSSYLYSHSLRNFLSPLLHFNFEYSNDTQPEYSNDTQPPISKPIPTLPLEPLSPWISLSPPDQSNFTFTFVMDAGGFSPRIRCLFGTFYQAMLTNRTFILDYWDIQYRKGGSTYGNWTEFFEPVESSQYIPQIIPQGAVIVPKDPNEQVPTTVPHVFGVVGNCPGEWLPGDKSFNLRQAALRLWKFNNKTADMVRRNLAMFEDWSTRRYHAIHIRRGDKVNPGYWKEGDYIETEIFCKALERLVGGNVTDPVFVASDSEINIRELRNVRPDWEIWSIPAEHLRNDDFATDNFNIKPYHFRVQFTELFLSEITMLRHAHFYVACWYSNVSELLSILRSPSSPPIFSVDRELNKFIKRDFV